MRKPLPAKGALPTEWFIIYSGLVPRVIDELDRLGCHSWRPFIKTEKVLRRTRKYSSPARMTIESPMFPGYLFVAAGRGVDPKNLKDVSGVLMVSESLYARISHETVLELQKSIEAGEFDDVKGLREVFHPGQQIRVTEGSFTGLFGRIEKAFSGQPAKILLDIFGRETRVMIPIPDLEAA